MGITDNSPPNDVNGVFILFSSWAILSASLARRSFSFSENIATDLALFTRLCLIRDFFAANSAAVKRKYEYIFSVELILIKPFISSSVWATGTDGTLELPDAVSGFWLNATVFHDGAGFSNSESELVVSSFAMQSVLRCIEEGSAAFNLLAHSAPPLGPIVK